MPISSLTVLVDPAQRSQVCHAIEHSQCGEVAVVQGDYLVVVLETESTGRMKDTFDVISQLPGVIQVYVAYHSVEEEY